MNCTKCNNTGWIFIEKDGTTYAQECTCVKQRQSLARLERSGLSKLIDKYTFERYETNYDFQKQLLEKAKSFINKKGVWFTVVGVSGSGKSMICTAICGELLKKGKEIRFMSWLTESVKLKQNINNFEVYEPLIEDYKTCDVLYIDDFFKSDNTVIPSSADIKLANEILNYRYNNGLTTLLSSERTMKQLIDIDEAVAGRIIEMSEDYLTELIGKEKNYRLRNYL